MWWLYEVALLLGLCLYLPKALWRRRLPHRGWSMRLGRYPAGVVAALAQRRSVWIHAVSLGEVRAVQPVVRALAQRHPDDPVVLSTVTPGGFDAASQQAASLPAAPGAAQAGRGVAVFFPLDVRPCVRRAFDALHPRILLLVESELWPTVIREARTRGVPVAVINGRISPRAFRRYALVAPWLRGTLERVDLFLMQSQPDADRLVQLGASRERVRVIGSLKCDASIGSRPSAEAIRTTAARLGLNGRDAVVVCGSTHRGEEALLLQAYGALRRSHPRLRLILAPRHLERLAEVEALVRRRGLRAARLSEAPAGGWEVGIVDTFGQLPQYYGLATVAVIGGSFIPHGGQNPLEAASLGKPILFGPSMHNFADITQHLLASRAAQQLAAGGDLAGALTTLLEHPADADAMGRRAQELTEGSQGAARRTLDALAPLLT